MAETNSYSIGQNIGSFDFGSTGGGANNEAGGGGGSMWTTIFGQTLPALFQFGGATIVGNQQAKAQQIAAQNQGMLGFGNPFTNYQVPGGNNNNWVWIIIALVVVVALFLVLKKK